MVLPTGLIALPGALRNDAKSATGYEFDNEGEVWKLKDAPKADLVPTIALLSLFADGPCAMRGIAHLRLKESDRLEVLAANLRALGREAEVTEESLRVGAPTGPLHGARIVTRGDHRMAMAFAVAGLRVAGVEIDEPGCVAKSNPGFWDQFGRLEGRR